MLLLSVWRHDESSGCGGCEGRRAISGLILIVHRDWHTSVLIDERVIVISVSSGLIRSLVAIDDTAECGADGRALGHGSGRIFGDATNRRMPHVRLGGRMSSGCRRVVR
jgi:hypothetical protein